MKTLFTACRTCAYGFMCSSVLMRSKVILMGSRVNQNTFACIGVLCVMFWSVFLPNYIICIRRINIFAVMQQNSIKSCTSLNVRSHMRWHAVLLAFNIFQVLLICCANNQRNNLTNLVGESNPNQMALFFWSHCNSIITFSVIPRIDCKQ